MDSTENFGNALIQQLIAQGVRHFCISPGSRSTALTLAVAKEKKALSFVHFDERGLGFYALGLAKAVKEPVAIIVTSGTAVGNLLPAVMEAYHTYVPLILLTADRPPELQDTGANQTTKQIGIFQNFVRWQTDLPCPSKKLGPRFIQSIINYAVARAEEGPVQINCMLRKPFISNTKEENHTLTHSRSIFGEMSFPEHLIEPWCSKISSMKEGVVISGAHDGDPKAIVQLAKLLNWPLIADLSSGIRELGIPLPSYNLVLEKMNSKVEAVLHFGGPIVSAKVFEWIAKSNPPFYAHIAKRKERIDPIQQVSDRVVCDPSVFCRQMIEKLPRTSSSSWGTLWHTLSKEALAKSTHFFNGQQELTEPKIVQTLAETLSSETSLFIGNSMPIRDADSLFFSPKPTAALYTNRGLSGIDGNIATAIGIANGSKKTTIALLGDTAFLHDLNSLAAVKHSPHPIIFIVINNQGGGIFSFLPIAEQTIHLEQYFACTHSFTFKKAAEMFGISYHFCATANDWETTFAEAQKKGLSAIIEAKTDRQKNFSIHQEWTKIISENTTPRNCDDNANKSPLETMCAL